MAIITSAVFLDDAPRTAGEAMTNNGGSLTVRTDTRWHANSPAGMTGSLGAHTISSTFGGSYILDGRNVRWVAYDAGIGIVPAVGTIVTGGTSGANGYLLGVWASLTSAPTAVGAAMPATGFLKLREADVAFVDNDVLTGIGATTNGVDVVGWIEVVHTQAISITVPRLGDFTVRGDWFEIGTTSGVANQLMQVPTNGSATAYVPGVYVETAVGSGVYEFWPSLFAAGMTTTNLGTDDRSKFVCMETNGNVRFGHNGTTAVGEVPAANLKVRIPNVIGRQCTAADKTTNVIPSATATTRPDFVTTSAGAIDIQNFMSDWYFYFFQPYSVDIANSCTFDYVSITECASPVNISNGGNGISQSINAVTLQLTSCFAGGNITDWVCYQYSPAKHVSYTLFSSGQTFTRVKSGVITYVRGSGMAFQITQSSSITFNDCYMFNGNIKFITSFHCVVDGIDSCDRFVGETNTTTALYVAYILSSSDDIVIRNVTFGLKGAIANVHPYGGIFYVGQSTNIKLRECGSRTAFLNGGSANNPNYIFASSGGNLNVRLQRIYMMPTRTFALSTTNSDKGMIYEHVYGDMTDTMVIASLNSSAKNCGGTNTTTGQASVYGTHFRDAFASDTDGMVVLSLNEPTVETTGYYTVVAGTPKFTSAGSISMATLNDEVIIEQDYFVKGCTGLPITSPVVTGTNVTYSSGARWGNHDIYFQIDTGSGWNGTWVNLTGANLNSFSASIDPAVGFKLKYRIVCAVAATNNVLVYIRISTTSTLAAQTANLYPLDTVTVAVTVKDSSTLAAMQNARVRITTDVGGYMVLEGVTNASGILTGTTQYASHAITGTVRRATVASGTLYKPGSISGTTTSSGFSATVLLIADE